MSASAIADGIAANLNAASALGANHVSTDYSVMETTSACAVVVSFTALRSPPATFGTTKIRLWTFTLQGFIKDTGDYNAIMTGILSFTDTIVSSIESDDTLQGTAANVQELRAERTPGEFFAPDQIGTAWIPVTFELDVEEYP